MFDIVLIAACWTTNGLEQNLACPQEDADFNGVIIWWTNPFDDLIESGCQPIADHYDPMWWEGGGPSKRQIDY